MKRCICLIVLNLVFGQFLRASDTAKQQDAITRLEQAVSKNQYFRLAVVCDESRCPNRGPREIGERHV